MKLKHFEGIKYIYGYITLCEQCIKYAPSYIKGCYQFVGCPPPKELKGLPYNKCEVCGIKAKDELTGEL